MLIASQMMSKKIETIRIELQVLDSWSGMLHATALHLAFAIVISFPLPPITAHKRIVNLVQTKVQENARR